MFFRSVRNCKVVKCINPVTNFGTKALATKFNKNARQNVIKKRQENLIQISLNKIPIESSNDWNKVRQFILENEQNYYYNDKNIHGMIMGFCVSVLKRTDLAKSYLKYLSEENIKPNLATLGKYLTLLYQNNQDKLSKQDELEIIELCESICKEYPILDSTTLEHMVVALSLTKEWKKCVDMFQRIKLTSNPSIITYSALIASAFSNKDEKLAWMLLNEMIEDGKSPLSNIFHSYLATVKRLKKKENIGSKLETLFKFFKDTEIKCQEDVVDNLVDVCKKLTLPTITTVKFSGHCQNCETKLDKLELTESEFSEIKDTFFKNVIVGKDIFIKSDPQEMVKFKNFINNMEKFDVVLDGLNIAYSEGPKKGPQVFSNLVSSVVSHFVQQDKSVLMLGRNHMMRWPRNNWNYITQNCTVFLTQNISQDDPYLLYCALHSGKDTIIVTKDLMRGHKFLLKERKYKILFDRWLSQRQYHLITIKDKGQPIFRIPPDFSAIAQKKCDVWHIPYNSSDLSLNENWHKTWICVGK